MDAFKIVVVLAIIASLAVVGFIGAVSSDAILGVKIPDEEFGVVLLKAPVSDAHPADYMVTLTNGKTLYIQTENNATLYGSLRENVSYLFSCRIDYLNQMRLVDSANQVNRTST